MGDRVCMYAACAARPGIRPLEWYPPYRWHMTRREALDDAERWSRFQRSLGNEHPRVRVLVKWFVPDDKQGDK